MKVFRFWLGDRQPRHRENRRVSDTQRMALVPETLPKPRTYHRSIRTVHDLDLSGQIYLSLKELYDL